jgi:hypothetical protein
MIKFQVNDNGVKLFHEKMTQIAKSGIKIPSDTIPLIVILVIVNIKKTITEQALRKTGGFIKSIYGLYNAKKGVGVVGSSMGLLASVIEHGSKAHDIYPRTKKALAFRGRMAMNIATHKRLGSMASGLGGRKTRMRLEVYKHVHHPGTKPRYVFQTGFARSANEVEELIKQEIDRAGNGAN